MRLIEPVEMVLHAIVIFLLCCSSAFAEKNFWHNDICRTDDDCTGLKSCDETFGCTMYVCLIQFMFNENNSIEFPIGILISGRLRRWLWL